ncbi:MAG: SCO family protein [Candidatus Poseidoniales archaeon]|jgi:cytochrome oxidase Cu insertion factor (SCO1/SenC/PrrC family)
MSRVLPVLMASLLLLAGCTVPGESDNWTPHGEPLENVKVQDFTLTSSEGTAWTYSEEATNTTLAIAFLFTNCLDICPIVTHNMKWVKSQLTDDELNKTTFLTITVDPWRDNVTTLHEWKTGTNSEWTHLTSSSNDSDSPSMNALQNVWVNFGVGLTIEEYDANANNQSNGSNSSARHHPDDYTVNHETGTILVDRFGHQRVWWGDNDWVLDLFLEDLRYLHTL